MRILHCSDVHITQDYFATPWRRLGWRRWIALLELTVGLRHWTYRNAPHVLRRIVRDVERVGADHLILSGDVTAYATEDEFRTAREILSPLADDPRRITVVRGNHDAYTPNAVASQRFEKHFGDLLVSDLPEHRREGPYPFVRLLGDEAAVVGLCSGRLPPLPGIAFGTIGAAQLEGLRDIVHDERLAGRAILVVVHHSPLNARGTWDARHHRLVDAKELFQIVRGPRFAVLHGHIHERYHHRATDSRPHTFGAGSSTHRGTEGYWIIDVRNGRIAESRTAIPGA